MTQNNMLTRRFKNYLQEHFVPNIKLDDIPSQHLSRLKSENINDMKFTRALTAFFISTTNSIKPDDTLKYVTDGFDDGGIDGAFVDEEDKILYLIQSKWSEKSDKSPELQAVLRFIDGAKMIMNAQYKKWNSRMLKMKYSIEKALTDTGFTIKLVLVYSSTQQLSQAVKERLKDFCGSENGAGIELVSFEGFNVEDLYNRLSSGKESITVPQFTLTEFGYRHTPFVAYSGTVTADQFVELWKKYHNALFSQNIRSLLSQGDIHREMISTLQNNPENFWYFNNGVTVLGSEVKKSVLHGGKRDLGQFEIKDFNIINGAQTVGTLGKFFDENPDADAAQVEVFVRLIQINANNPKLATEITRANNRQNKIDSRDFVSLDEFQQKLAVRLKEDGIDYIYKRSEEEKNLESNHQFTVEELARALANQYTGSINPAIDFHRGPSTLFEGLEKNESYRQLFSKNNVSEYKAWNAVRMMRMFDDVINNLQKKETDDDLKAILTFGDYLIEAVLFDNNSELLKDDNYVSVKEISEKDNEVEQQVKNLLKQIVDFDHRKQDSRTWTAKFKSYLYPRDLLKSISPKESLQRETQLDLKSEIETVLASAAPKISQKILEFESIIPSDDDLGHKLLRYWLQKLYNPKLHYLGGVQNIQQYFSHSVRNVEKDFLFRIKYEKGIVFEFRYSYYGKTYNSILYHDLEFKSWLESKSNDDKVKINDTRSLKDFERIITRSMTKVR